MSGAKGEGGSRQYLDEMYKVRKM